MDTFDSFFFYWQDLFMYFTKLFYLIVFTNVEAIKAVPPTPAALLLSLCTQSVSPPRSPAFSKYIFNKMVWTNDVAETDGERERGTQ